MNSCSFCNAEYPDHELPDSPLYALRVSVEGDERAVVICLECVAPIHRILLQRLEKKTDN